MVSGCNICRARRIKCDSVSGDCRNCARIGEKCDRGGSTSTSNRSRTADSLNESSDRTGLAMEGGSNNLDERRKQLFTQAGLKRRRNLLSCSRCRRLKRKCDGSFPCDRCVKSKKIDQCSYEKEKADESLGSDSRSSFALLHGCTSFPETDLLYDLVKKFFFNIYPSRLLGFLHEPTFMMQIDDNYGGEDLDELLLLLAICAVASKTNYTLEKELWDKGTVWAKDVFRLLMTSLNTINVTKLMTVVLLHEHERRVGNSSSGFLLSGLATRYCQILQINLEYDTDIYCEQSSLTTTEKESRRRLMWCCYIIDSMTASGVAQLTMIDPNNVSIQLPMTDDHFLFKRSCVTEMMEEGKVFPNSVTVEAKNIATENMDHRAFLLRIILLRSKVLSYVKRFDKDIDLWNEASEFNCLLREIQRWKDNLPQVLGINPTVLYIRKGQGMLSPLFHLHILYHLCYCDIYRVIFPGLSYSMKSQIDAVQLIAPKEFLDQSQDSCFEHAKELTNILNMEVRYQGDGAMNDTDLIAAHEASRVALLYMSVASRRINETKVGMISKLLQDNIQFLQELTKRFPTAELGLKRTQSLIDNFAHDESFAKAGSIEANLHPLSNVRMIREKIYNDGGELDRQTQSTGDESSSHISDEYSTLVDGLSPSGLENWLVNNQFGDLI